MFSKTIHRYILGTLLLLLTGCGYRLLSSPTPFNASSVTIIPFHENEPVGLSPILANYLSLQLAQSGVALSNSSNDTGATLTGYIKSAGIVATPTSALESAIPSFQINLKLTVKLEDAKGRTLWNKAYTLTDSFLQDLKREPESVLVTESNRRVALNRLAQLASEKICSDLMIAHSLRPPPQAPESEASDATTQ